MLSFCHNSRCDGRTDGRTLLRSEGPRCILQRGKKQCKSFCILYTIHIIMPLLDSAVRSLSLCSLGRHTVTQTCAYNTEQWACNLIGDGRDGQWWEERHPLILQLGMSSDGGPNYTKFREDIGAHNAHFGFVICCFILKPEHIKRDHSGKSRPHLGLFSHPC